MQKGHEVYIAIAAQSPLLPELQDVPAPRILELPFRKPFEAASAWRLRRFVRDHRIEILHAHMARDYPLAALAAGKADYPRLVLTRHVLFPMSPLHKLTRRRVARVIAVSRAVADGLRAQTIFAPEKIVTIHNGIDIAKFARAEAVQDVRNARLRVGTVGHLAPIKGFEDFIRAATIVCQERNDVDFIIAGEDKSATGENRSAIENLIRELGMDLRVELLGWINDLQALLGTFDVFVSAARAEPFGLVIVEAMAAGVPVIATRSEGANEIITDGVTGRLVPIGDARQMANWISKLLRDRDQRERLSTAARQAVSEKFSLGRMIAETEDVYRAVLTK
jgi:glycosyltransferase involved in cell wall biosynthesis